MDGECLLGNGKKKQDKSFHMKIGLKEVEYILKVL